MTRPPGRWSAAAVVLAVAAACSETSGTPLYGPFPSPLHVVSADPRPGATGVPTDATLTIAFDDFPDPASVQYGGITLSSGTVYYDVDFTSDPVDLVAKALVLRPRSRLVPGAGYVAVVRKGALAALGGGALDGTVELPFTAGELPSGAPPPAVPSFARDVAGLLAGCAYPGCHAASVDGKSGPQAHLDLTPDVAYAQLVDVAAAEVPSLARVRRGQPSSSYLLRKLVGSRDVRGEPMPIVLPDVVAPLTPAQLATVRDWIAGGCPP